MRSLDQRLRIIAGIVGSATPAPNLDGGSETYMVVRNSAGYFTVRFIKPFRGRPSVTSAIKGTTGAGSNFQAHVDNITQTSFDITINQNGTPTDAVNGMFTAIGI